MSRIGSMPVELPKGVTWAINGDQLQVKGPKGQVLRKLAQGITIEESDGVVRVQRADDTPAIRANHGLMRALLAGMVEGVSRGFERELEIQGVGYKAEKKGKNVVLHLGYSHPINFEPPQGIEIDVGKNNILTVKGHDKQVVGQVASELRGFRPPDSYKGKGVRYKGEYVRLKAGKTAQ